MSKTLSEARCGRYLRTSVHRETHQFRNRRRLKKKTMKFTPIILLVATLLLWDVVDAFPTPGDYRYVDRDFAGPGAHQLASWIVSQLRSPKEYVPAPELPILPYRLPLQTKRNSEVSNAIIGSEETQKMYRDGRK